MNNIVGIIGAMDVEVSTLCQKLQNKEVVKFGGLEFNHGFLNSKEVVIVKSGVGKVNAALCVQTLVNKFNVTQIINTGIAGATGKGLGVFDFVYFFVCLGLFLPSFCRKPHRYDRVI